MSTPRLSSSARLRLLRFVCSFAWADLQVTPAERAAVQGLVRRLRLTAAEKRQVSGWLEVPPPADDVDPNDIPPGQRQLFLDEVRRLVVADGRLSGEEQSSYRLFERLLR